MASWTKILVRLLLSGTLSACGGTEEPRYPLSELPAYTSNQARLFDDSISSDVFGLEAESHALDKNPKFRKRVEWADQIVPVRLVAVSAERSNDSIRYLLLVEPNGEPLSGPGFVEPFELSAGSRSPSRALLRSMDTQIVGKVLIVFLRRFRHEERMAVHFRAEPDTVEIRDAVKKALSKQASKE